MVRTAIIGAALWVSLCACAVAAEDEGFLAYQQGDYARAFQILSGRAQEADPEIHFRLGQMYSNGWGTDRDPVQAAAWYQHATSSGHGQAAYNLAGMYHKGVGVTQNFAEARRLAARAADLGYTKAGIYLGDIYATGNNVKADLKLAYAWFGVAAAGGDPVASLNQARIGRLLSPEVLHAAQSLVLVKPQAKPEPVTGEQPLEVLEPPASYSAAAFMPATVTPSATAVPSGPAPALTAPAPTPPITRTQSPADLPPAALRAESPVRTHLVKPGESLFSIARQVRSDDSITTNSVIAALKQANPDLAGGRPLKAGERLRIPAAAVTAGPVQAARPAPAKTVPAAAPAPVMQAAAPRPAPIPLPATARSQAVALSAGSYIDVKPGDTLFSIAQRVRPDPRMPMSAVIDALRGANPWIQGPQSVRVGERVRIPDFGAVTSASLSLPGAL